MERRLSLHQLTALDASPIELIAIAERLGIAHVCLFTHVPAAAAHVYPSVPAEDVTAVRTALAASGVALCNLEVFPLDADEAPDRLDHGLETGAALGATRATAHIHDAENEAQATDRFARFARRAASFGIVAGLEFNNFSAVRDVIVAEQIVRAAGEGSLVLDTLHLARGGGGPVDALRVADLVGYVQLSDGPETVPAEARWREAVSDRMLVGEGALPLAQIIGALSPSAMYEVEAPQSAARKAGIGAEERCRRAVEAARRLLHAIPEDIRA